MYCTDKIAVLLATYQGEKYIREQLESLLNQSFDEWLVFVHDDGSTDNTVNIINEYVLNYPSHFVKIAGTKTGSAKNNFFYLMSQVEAPYYMCCDQDDIWLPEKIEVSYEVISQLQNDNVPLLVFSELSVVNDKLEIVAEKLSDYQKLDYSKVESKDIVLQNCITGCTMMVNRKLRDMAISATDISQIIMHDWWCALIASEYGKIVFIPKNMVLYRQHANNSVGAKKIGSLSFLIKRINNYKEIKNSLVLTRKQATVFCETFCVSNSNLLYLYGEIGNKKKISRLRFYLKNKMCKSGIIRNIGFIIWG